MITITSLSSFSFLIFILFLCFVSAFSHGYFTGDGDEAELYSTWDYTPPSPPPPSPPPRPPSVSCEGDLGGVGSFDTVCELNKSLNFESDVYIEGSGDVEVGEGVELSCRVSGCAIIVNLTSESGSGSGSGSFELGRNASIVCGRFELTGYNVSLEEGSVVNTTGLAGDPPAQTSGRPSGVDGSGGGHGGRGAGCVLDDGKLPEDVWGGDAYSWSGLENPTSYGSRGGSTSKEMDYGGGGGGYVLMNVTDTLEVDGLVLARGGDGGTKGGGGSGGSIQIVAHRMEGIGKISASGGDGFAGGGGGRVSIDIYSRHDDPKILVHGGKSHGCPGNAGAAGTFFDAVTRSLIISNHNRSTQTDTLLLEFPNQPLWTNVYVRNHAKASVPLLWSRVQVQGQLSLSCGGVLVFGLAHYSSSEFELMAEELLMSDSIIEVYGALRMSVKIFLMLNSKMLIDGGGDAIVATSLLEASNLIVLKGSSAIQSNANLGVHGQGLLNLTGSGDLIEAQRLVLSLFYNINVGPGSVIRGPLKSATKTNMTPKLYCELQDCPLELLHPPEDCNVNSTLSFTLQICRVEDVIVEGLIQGSVVHFHWIRTVVVQTSGVVSASGLGCTGGVGQGKMLHSGIGGGGGHGGKGGDGYYNGTFAEGGIEYGNADLPCELGSGSGNDSLNGSTAGGGIIAMGSLEHSLSSLSIYGSLRADGETFQKSVFGQDYGTLGNSDGGPGGGSGGTILLFLHTLTLGDSALLSSIGGNSSPRGGGGGGGGRIHFDWSDIPTGDAYQPLTSVKGSIQTRGGLGRDNGFAGRNGTITGKACPKGLYGIFCEECPPGTFKNVSGSQKYLCRQCPPYELPHRAKYTSIRGGVAETPCPYKCIGDRYHMPHCYTALEELIATLGGPWLFGLFLFTLLILLAGVLSVARMKFVGTDELPAPVPTKQGSPIDHSFPFLESLNEVLETNRAEESQNHVHRMYFLGPNSFREPWHLPHCPPEQIKDIVYEGAFNRFVDEINAVAAYQWWEGSICGIISILAYPLASSWQEWCRKKKLQRLREFVRSEYDHSCLRSCRSRALYEGLKVAATSDLMLAYLDFYLGGDEKRSDLPPHLRRRFPMCIVFGGDGSYMTPFSLQSDNLLTSLMSQSIPPTIWYRLVAGLNARLRLVRRGHLRTAFVSIISWLETHANPALTSHGVQVDLAWFQATTCEYCQFGLVVYAVSHGSDVAQVGGVETRTQQSSSCADSPLGNLRNGANNTMSRRICGTVLDISGLRNFKEKTDIFFPFSYIIHNTRPIGQQDLVGLMISILLLGDFSLVLLTSLQLYSISLVDFFLFLLILPLGILSPFPAGINALFSHGPKRSAGLARVYALWNITSIINVAVASVCGFVHYKTQSSSRRHSNFQPWNFSMDESGWWMLPTGLLLCKCVQARLVDMHVANLEIQDRSLYSDDPNFFWQS